MEILKQLLLNTFENKLKRLEKRSSQQMKDLQFTGVAFIKQGKQLERITSIKIEPKQLKKTNITHQGQRDISAHLPRNRNEQRQVNKPQEIKKKATTPDYAHLRSRSRAKTPSTLNLLKRKHNGTKTDIATPTHISKKSAHNKLLSTTFRDKTLDKTEKKPVVIIKKKEGKREVTPSTSQDNTQIKPLDKSIENNRSSSNHNNTAITLTQLEIDKEKPKIIKLTNLDLDSIDTGGNIKRPESPKPESPTVYRKPLIVHSKLNIDQAIKENCNQPSFTAVYQYLKVKDKLSLFASMKCFKGNLLTLILQLKQGFRAKHKLTSDFTLSDRISEMKAKYKSDQLNYSIPPFQTSRGAVKAVELLNEEVYNRIYHQTQLVSPLNQIVLVYRLFFQFLNIDELCSIEDDTAFWVKASAYILKHNNGQTGSFFSQSGSLFDFSSQNVMKIMHLIADKEETIKPTYYSKICGTTGLIVFLLKDALEYCGVIYLEKKTVPAILYQRLLYMKTIEEKVDHYIGYLKG